MGSLAENKIFITFLLEPTGILPLTEGVGASSPYPPKESGAGQSITAEPFQLKKDYDRAHSFSGKKKKSLFVWKGVLFSKMHSSVLMPHQNKSLNCI